MYNPKSKCADDFINHEEIVETLAYAEKNKENRALIDEILEKAKLRKGLSHREAAVLLDCDTGGQKSGDLCPGRADQERFLRQPDRHVCAAVSFQLLHQRLRVLSVSSEK